MIPVGKSETIGLIGVGVMGLTAALKLKENGWSLKVCDAAPAALARARQSGLETVASPAEAAAGSRAVLMLLPGPQEIEDAVTGPNGCLATATADLIIVDLATSDPNATRALAGRLAEKRIHYLDAPILGRPGTVGRWTLPVGGSSEALEAARPVLADLAANIIHLGGSGLGHTAKLLNQLMFGAINAMTAEMMALAGRVGLGRGQLFELISGSQAATVSGLFLELGRRVSEDRYQDPTFTIDLLQKDTRLALALARSAGVEPGLARTVEALNELGRAQGLGAEDTSALWRAVDRAWAPPA